MQPAENHATHPTTFPDPPVPPAPWQERVTPPEGIPAVDFSPMALAEPILSMLGELHAEQRARRESREAESLAYEALKLVGKWAASPAEADELVCAVAVDTVLMVRKLARARCVLSGG